MSFNRWMAKQGVVHPYHRSELSDEKEQMINTPNNMDESSGYYVEWSQSLKVLWFHLLQQFWNMDNSEIAD